MSAVKLVVKVGAVSPCSQEVRSIIPLTATTALLPALPGDKAPSFPSADRGHGEAEINDQTAFVLR